MGSVLQGAQRPAARGSIRVRLGLCLRGARLQLQAGRVISLEALPD